MGVVGSLRRVAPVPSQHGELPNAATSEVSPDDGNAEVQCKAPAQDSFAVAPPFERTRQSEISAPELRGISMLQLKEFYNFQKEFFETGKHDIKGTSSTILDVLKHVVSPVTVPLGCSWVEVVAKCPQQPEFFVSYTPGLVLKDMLESLQFLGSKRGVRVYWLHAFATHDFADASKGCPMSLAFSVVQSHFCQGTVLLLSAEKPKDCAFRASWCMLEMAHCLQVSKQRDFCLDLAAHLPPGAQKFHTARDLQHLPASSVLHLFSGNSMAWERSDERAAWPTWLLREGLALDFDLSTLIEEELSLLEELRLHLRKRLAPAAIYGLAGGRPVCYEDLDILRSLLKEFPEAPDEPLAYKETALFRAAAWSCPGSLALLLAARADATVARVDGVTPLQVARARGHPEVLKLLGISRGEGSPGLETSKTVHDVVVLQDDIPWAASVPMPEVFLTKLVRRERLCGDPATSGMTLQQLEQLAELVEAVTAHVNLCGWDKKLVLWDLDDEAALLQVEEHSDELGTLARKARNALVAMKATPQRKRNSQECDRLVEEWRALREELAERMASANLYHICDCIVKPMTYRFQCSWVNFVADQPKHQVPRFFVSHWWGAGFKETLCKLRFHAEQRSVEGAYWICTFANNQHDVQLGERLEETPFCRVMDSELCRGTVALVDPEANIFSRVWCVYELHKSELLKKERPGYIYDMAIWHPPAASGKWGNQADGYVVKQAGAVLDLEGKGQVAQFVALEAPAALARRGVAIDIFLAQSTQPEDKRLILQHIAGTSKASTVPDADHQAFKDLNRNVRRRFAGAAITGLMYSWTGETLKELQGLLSQFPHAVDQEDSIGRTPFWIAADHSRAEALRALAKARANVNKAQFQGSSPLFMAAQEGRVQIVRLLLEVRGDVHQERDLGHSPTCIASQHGQAAALRLLLKAQGSVNKGTKSGCTPTFIAAEYGHIDALNVLLEARADVNAPKPNGVTPLLIAAEHGHVDVLEALLEAAADVNLARDNGATPTLIASENGRCAALKVLVKALGDPNMSLNDGATPAFWACRFGRAHALQLLLEAQADVNMTKNNGCGPAYVAAEFGNVQVLKMLLQGGADFNFRSRFGRTPTDIAGQNGRLVALKMLLDAKAQAEIETSYLQNKPPRVYSDLNRATWDGTPTFLAACEGDVDALIELVKARADVNIARLNGRVTPAFIAAERGHADALEVLLEARADPDLARDNGATPILIASENGRCETLRILVEARGDVDRALNNGETPAFWATRKGHSHALQLLIEARADLEKTKDNGCGPTFVAAEHGKVQVLNLLLEARVDVNLASHNGNTPISIAAENGRLIALRRLLEARGDPDKPDNNGATPVFWASQQGQIETLQVLLEAQADVQKAKHNGETPLMVAESKGHLEIVALLKSHLIRS